jgi:hypothetical protein
MVTKKQQADRKVGQPSENDQVPAEMGEMPPVYTLSLPNQSLLTQKGAILG